MTIRFASPTQAIAWVLILVFVGALIARWRDVLRFLLEMTDEPLPDLQYPYEDAQGRRVFDGRAVGEPGGHAFMPISGETVTYRNEWPYDWDA